MINEAPSRGTIGPEASSAWTRAWLESTAFCAVGATLLDGVLLQRKHDIFTGGFLSVDHLRGAGETVAFLVASVISDAGVAGVLVALSLAISMKLRLGSAARRLLSVLAGLLPFVLANVASYRILEHLGDAFDFDLMFSLVGGKPVEIVAVAAGPLQQFGLLSALAAGSALVLVWLVQKVRPAGAWIGAERWRWRRPGANVFGLLVLALAVTTSCRIYSESLDNGLRRKPAGMILGWPVTASTDFDRDGYGLLTRVRDTAPFNSAIHPYAVDIPGNGIDEDGVAGDLPVSDTRYRETGGAAPQFAHRPDVVLVLLETFRADVVGANLNGRPVTPAIDALAASGVSSHDAWSHNGYTVQSRFHLFSGSLANMRGGTTLIDDFLANGYDVGYFSGQDESFGGGQLPVGYERASVFFDARQDRAARYSDFSTAGSLAVPFTVLADRVHRFLSTRDPKKPLFLYVNFHDTHFPYTHRFVEPIVDDAPLARGDISPGRRDELWRTYLNTAANVDRAIGGLLQSVRTTTGREPGVIVTADHGESLFEDGFLGHGYGLNEAQTKVPLIVSGLPMEIREPWGQVDLRDSLRTSLSGAASVAGRPSLRSSGDHVFQYLGAVETPAQIAFMSSAAPSIYDFRRRRFRGAGGDWQSPADLSGGPRETFLSLVNYWERMLLAARGRE